MKIDSVTVAIPVTNLSQAVDWYRKLFGNQEELTPADGIWELCITPTFTLQLFESATKEISSKSIGLEIDDIEATHQQLIAHGIEAGEINTVPDVVRYFEFSDPFGNLLSFHQLLYSAV